MAAMLFPSMALAQTWEVLGPDGGSFLGTVTDAANADVITAVTTYPSPSAAWGSTDGGQSWTKKGDIPYYYLYDMCAFDASTIYVLGGAGIYVTTDGGITWTEKAIPSTMGWGYALCVHPTDPNEVHVAGYLYQTGNYKLVNILSTDGGSSWTKNVVANGFAIPYDIAISKSNPSVLYMCGYGLVTGGYGGFMYKSDDGGSRFNDITAAVEPVPLNNDIMCVAVDPTNENNVYAGYKAAYRTTDGGVTWNKDTSTTFNLESLGVDPVNPAHVYGASAAAIYVSSDSAQTWTQHAGLMGGYPSGVEVAPAMHSTVYITSTYGGAFKSTDSGATWDTAHKGMYTVTIPSLAVAPSQPETVIADVASASQLVGSYDCGDNWTNLVYPEGCSGTINDLLINSDDPDIIIALEAG